jgi:hypothetical protein
MTLLPARLLATAILALSLLLSGCNDGASEEVRDAFDAYKDAIAQRNGDALLKVIDPQNVKHYEQFLQIARAGTKEQIARLPLVHRLYVLMMRNRLRTGTLRSIDGAGFVKIAVERGWYFGGDDMSDVRLGRITVNQPRASATVYIGRFKTDARFEFVNVEGTWLVNDECLDRLVEKELEREAAAMNISEDGLLFRLESEEFSSRGPRHSGRRVSARPGAEDPGGGIVRG